MESKKSVRIGIILLLSLIFIGASVVPFVYQTKTLWYKLGIDRVMLYTGQLAGLYAAFLLLLQLALIAKIPLLTRAFGQGRLNRIHQFNGKFILFIAFLHILLILLPEGLSNIPIGMKFIPEMIGGFLFFLLLSLPLSVWARTRFKMPYTAWKTVHRVLGLSACVSVMVHVVLVSDAFTDKTLLSAFLGVSGLFTFSYALGKYLQKRDRGKGDL